MPAPNVSSIGWRARSAQCLFQRTRAARLAASDRANSLAALSSPKSSYQIVIIILPLIFPFSVAAATAVWTCLIDAVVRVARNSLTTTSVSCGSPLKGSEKSFTRIQNFLALSWASHAITHGRRNETDAGAKRRPWIWNTSPGEHMI
jgi:hypothetical protein